jgi:hypothetical protein
MENMVSPKNVSEDSSCCLRRSIIPYSCYYVVYALPAGTHVQCWLRTFEHILNYQFNSTIQYVLTKAKQHAIVSLSQTKKGTHMKSPFVYLLL